VAQEVSLSIRRRKAVQVAQLEQVAHEAWLGWKRSKQPAITIQKQQTPQGVIVTETMTPQCGDPRFLHEFMVALAEIRQVLDMDSVPLGAEGGTLVLNQTQKYVLIIAPRR
jgi:hypothetical protein